MVKKGTTHFDYIIVGAGAAGLMLADAMGADSYFEDKSILLLDKDAKNKNDRTWCFWERGAGRFDDILYRTWSHIYFGGQEFSNRLNIAPYRYKMVQGIDFYTSYFDRISTYENIKFSLETVNNIKDQGEMVSVTTDQNEYTAKQVLNSIFEYKMATTQKKYPVLRQHFLGWFIKTTKPVFDGSQATFMDFSIPQKGNTRFMYVLPFSENEGLVEYTLFSENVLPKEEYEEAIEHYIRNDLNCNDFEIVDMEEGSIPMTCYTFKDHNTANILHIGTAGGWSKPSTGYTFKNTAKKVPELVRHLKSGKALNRLGFKNKFWYYDLLLLDILHKNNSMGQHIFESLFKNREPQLILKFLEEETNFWEDLKFISGSPTMPFAKALFSRLR